MMDWVTEWVAAGGYVGVFVLMFLENLIPPLPSEVIMPLAGFVAARGELSLAGVVIAGLAGAMLGNVFWYELARMVGLARILPFVERYGRWLGLTVEDLERAERTLKRRGPAFIAIGRLLPGIRTMISVPAGVIHIPRTVFYLWTGIGSAIWVGGLALVGYWLEEHHHQVEEWLAPFGVVMGVLIAAGCGLHVWRALRRAKQAG